MNTDEGKYKSQYTCKRQLHKAIIINYAGELIIYKDVICMPVTAETKG